MNRRHALVISMFLGSLAAVVSALPNWTDATTPAFVGSLILNVSSFIGALSTDRVKRRGREEYVGSFRRRGMNP